MKAIEDMTTAEWRKAWTNIVVAYETERSGRKGVQAWVNHNGLCWAFMYLGNCDSLYECSYRLGCKFPDSGCEEYPTRKSDIIRAWYAAMFAAMTPKEFLEICESGGDQ